MILTPAAGTLLKRWTLDIKARKFENLIYKSFGVSNKTVTDAILALREANISPFNCEMSEEDFRSWIMQVVTVRLGGDLFWVPQGQDIEVEELRVAEALGVNCWEVKDPNHPNNGDLFFCNKYSNIAALMQTNYDYLNIKYRQLDQLF